MNTLLELLQQPLARRLGWTLLHFFWQGALLAVLFLAARGALHRRSPNARYLAGCLALLLMAAAPVVTFRALDVTPAIHHAAAVAATLPPVLPAVMPAGDARPTFDGLARLAVWLDGLIEAALPWLVGAWAVGVFALSLRLGLGWFQVRRLRRRLAEIPDASLVAKLARLQRRLGVSRPVRLLKSALVEVPTVIGWFRPVILLPASTITGLSPLQLELILAHELAHLRRGDYWVNLFQILLETLLFYHPAVWWVSRCVRQDREHCCDDLAVAACGNRLAYAQALATLEELRQLPANVAFAASGGSLLARIKHVLGLPVEAAPSGWRRSVGGALIVLGLLAIAASAVIMVSPTRYRSIATISVQEVKALPYQQPQQGFTMNEFIPTEFERICSKAVLYPVIQQFDLRKRWAVRYHQGAELSTQDTFTLLVRHHLEVRRSSHSNLIEIRVISEDRAEAAQLANAIAQSYQTVRKKGREAESKDSMRILEEQLAKQTIHVTDLQTKVNELRLSLGIVESADPSVPTFQASFARERVSALAQQLESARSEYVLYNTKLQELKKLDRAALRGAVATVVTGEQILPTLMSDLNIVEQNLTRTHAEFGDSAPEVVRAEAMRKRVDSQIEARLDGIMTGLATQVVALKARVNAMEEELATGRKTVAEEAVNARPYYVVKRDLETQERIRDALMLRARQEQVDAAIPTTLAVEIIDMAEPGLAPVWPNFAMAGALAAGGLVLIFAGVSLCRRGPAVGLPAAV